MVRLKMSFDMRAPDFGAPAVDLYKAALDQSEWAERVGFESVTFMEHHASPDGYLPSPIVMAAAVAGRTRTIAIEIALMILTLYDPLKAAEDLAVLDLAANGRLRLVVGAGYRAEEFAQFGVEMKARGRLMERGVETLKKAWTGEPFEFEGRTVRILPRPAQQPRPKIVMGASSKAAAERAARIADDLQAPRWVHDIFAAELRRLGKPVPPYTPKTRKYFLLYVTHHPDAAWAKIGPHALHVNNIYGEWMKAMQVPAFEPVATVDELKASPMMAVVTPAQAVELARQDGELMVQPLFGGLDPAVAWESLRLIEREVIPALRD